MELADATVVKHGNQLHVQHGDDNGLIVRFYMHQERQGAESEKAGREIYKDVPYLQIMFPGDRSREVVRRARDEDKRRFPKQWAAFENQSEEVHEGTPVEEWGPLSRSMALTYKSMNIHTVEQLAAVSDANLHRLGHGGREMRDKAIAWLESAEAGAKVMELESENQKLRDDIEMLKAQIQELGTKKKRSPRKKTK